jgi:hypothetical protein
VKLTKVIQVIILVLLLIGTFTIGWIYISRLRLPYNSEGRYFDEATSVVYHQGAVEVYGLIFIILLAITIGVIFWIAKAKKQKMKN